MPVQLSRSSAIDGQAARLLLRHPVWSVSHKGNVWVLQQIANNESRGANDSKRHERDQGENFGLRLQVVAEIASDDTKERHVEWRGKLELLRVEMLGK